MKTKCALSIVLAAAACKPAPTAPPPDAQQVAAEAPTPERAAPATTSEPEHPWPVTLLDVRGHAPLPDGPRQDVWLAMDGFGATVEGGAIHKLSVARDGVPDRVELEYLLPVLFTKLAERRTKGKVTIWADERIPMETVVMALYTSGRAGFREYAFVVGKPGAREIIEVRPPQYVSETIEHMGTPWGDLGLSWSSEGAHASVFARYGDGPQPSGLSMPLDVGAGSCVFAGGARPDAEALRNKLREMCEVSSGKPFAVRIMLGGIESVGDLLWALGADDRPATCRLPATVLAGSGMSAPSCDGARPLRDAVAAFPKTARTLSFADAAAALGEANEASPEFVGDDEDVWGGLTGTEIGEAFGVGGLGLVGTGTEDDSASEDDANAPPLKVKAVVKRKRPEIKGQVTAKEIAAVAKANADPVRKCYESGLRRNKKAKGHVRVQFTIGPTGRIPVAVVTKSTLADRAIGNCIARAVKKHWKFEPRDDGGNAVVTQSFGLSAK